MDENATRGQGFPRLVQTVLDSTDARRSAEFWRQLLGLVYKRGHEPPPAGEDDPVGRDWVNLRKADGTPCLAIQQVELVARSTWPDPRVPQQLHLDLAVESREMLDAAHDRALGLGAALLLDRADDPVEALRVYADPDGHPFCIFALPS